MTEMERQQIDALEERLRPLRERLASHPLYASIRSAEGVRCFMASHVFAVWDFMSLLKALQRGVSCVSVPWVPTPYSESRRLINSIVLGEESDDYQGGSNSHFEIYRVAMQQAGADVEPVQRLLMELDGGATVSAALGASGAPAEARSFVADTFRIIEGGKLHAIAAAFTFGREDLIPSMFRGLVRDLNDQLAGQFELFQWYLERHIEVDGDEHGPMALSMVADICGPDAERWREAGDAAVTALDSRLRLWDGILARVRTVQPVAP